MAGRRRSAAPAPPRALPLAFQPPNVCFDADCAAAVDASFAAAIAVPLLAAAAVGAWVLRPPPKDLLDSGQVFEDPATGTLFEAPQGVSPEVDKNVRGRREGRLSVVGNPWLSGGGLYGASSAGGAWPPAPSLASQRPSQLGSSRPPQSLLAFKPISYTPWPVPSDAPGERIRIEVGKVGATEPRCVPGGSPAHAAAT